MNQTIKPYRIRVISGLVELFDVFALNFMQPFLALFVAEEFGVGLVEATFWTGLIMFFRTMSYAVLSPVWGLLADRVGCKKMLIRVIAGHGIAHLFMFFSGNVYQFTLFLCLDAAFGSISTPIYALLAKVTKPEKLSQVLSYQHSFGNAGSLLSPAAGGLLVYYVKYRPTYLIAALIFAGLIPLILFFIDEAPIQSPVKAEAQGTSKLRSYIRIIGLDFVGLLITSVSIAFLNPIKPLCLQTLGVVDKGELLYYISLLSTLSSVAYMVANLIGTRYVKNNLLPILSLAAMGMALAMSPLNSLTIFFVLSIGIRAIQAPIRLILMGGSSGRRRTGTHIGLLQSGQRIGSAISPFLVSTVATTVNLSMAFLVIAGFQLLGSVFLVYRNRKIVS